MQVDEQWQALSRQAARLIERPLGAIIASDPRRSAAFSFRVGGLYANFSRQRFDREAMATLLELARAAGVPEALRALFEGEPVNRSEARPALHTALRGRLVDSTAATRAHAQALQAQAQVRQVLARLEASQVTDIVNIGIGGSDLGPRLAVEALADFSNGRFRCHFLNNADASSAHRLVQALNPAHTAVVLVSKSFGTQETLLNGAILKSWLGGDDRLFAVTANVGKAGAFGVAEANILPMWDWVGGRYSLWSAVGLVIALSIGFDNYRQLLEGAREMDVHVLEQPLETNLAAWHGLTAIWNRNALGLDTQAVLPYDDRLALLPAYLQQLVMESLGKSVRQDGTLVAVATVPVIWGGPGTSSQHSFFQALHQGTDTVPCDFIGVARPAHPYTGSHDALLSHLLAQSEAMANGASDPDPQKSYPGNRPSTLLLLDELTPRSLGMLIALYEHSVFVQSVVWGINAFDQWGVELGKQIASALLPAVAAGTTTGVTDAITRTLLAEIQSKR